MNIPARIDRIEIIRTTGLTKSFGHANPPVLEDVSVSIARGEAIAIVGANGAGKSTLLKCLVGLLPPSDGTIEMFGQSFSAATARRKRELRRNIGFVFQFHGLVGRLSALSNVVHGALGQGQGWRAWHQSLAGDNLRRDAYDALARVGLAERAHDRAVTLSGGQSQRVAIARAIVHRPSLLLADEPVASLDPAAGQEVMALFRTLAGSDMSLLYTTHNLDHAMTFSDRILALRAGRVVIDQPTATLAPRDLERIYA